jgi:hypothetical protein
MKRGGESLTFKKSDVMKPHIESFEDCNNCSFRKYESSVIDHIYGFAIIMETVFVWKKSEPCENIMTSRLSLNGTFVEFVVWEKFLIEYRKSLIGKVSLRFGIG